MSVILDTDDCIAILRGKLEISKHIGPTTDLYVTAIRVSELVYGAHKVVESSVLQVVVQRREIFHQQAMREDIPAANSAEEDAVGAVVEKARIVPGNRAGHKKQYAQ